MIIPAKPKDLPVLLSLDWSPRLRASLEKLKPIIEPGKLKIEYTRVIPNDASGRAKVASDIIAIIIEKAKPKIDRAIPTIFFARFGFSTG